MVKNKLKKVTLKHDFYRYFRRKSCRFVYNYVANGEVVQMLPSSACKEVSPWVHTTLALMPLYMPLPMRLKTGEV